ncbi:MAG: flagellar hook protein FlgE [Gammaproteobacteria bacterium]|nr:flagellar hook protein FlgE [Gammaproteobacteria bacterium]MBU0785928.1 flagellar hook protein FlgE [Gammaproteobacteria bacterium]MBU0816541.1 flagellar hook protein FlgE [Gammaproteobacteria bacterium]MBU1788342.1 flagellar hook protein FlgE [Gammaproteobacteria bacterium]
MAFQTGLSGLNAASKNLDVIGNNIANAGTAGAKKSRAEFSEVIASTVGAGGSGGSAGIGVEVAAVSQEFSQGNISVTGNELDLAINGNGFFPLIPLNAQGQDKDNPSLYSRAGIFKLDNAGFIVNNNGEKLHGINYSLTGGQTVGPLKIDTSSSNSPTASSKLTMQFNLDARAAVWNAVTPNTALTTYGTSITAYDTQGSPIDVKVYMRKVADAPGPPILNQWEMYTDPTSAATATATNITTMQFDATGKLVAPTGTVPITLTSPNAAIGTFASTLTVEGSTQYASSFGVTTLAQDGNPDGSFTGIKISEDGVITARYSNGRSVDACQIQLVSFRNNQGLQPVGGGNWIATNASGVATPGTPGTASLGSVRSGALEDSNVDLTAELVNMMTAQRAYQANVQTIKTQDQALSALTQLR